MYFDADSVSIIFKEVNTTGLSSVQIDEQLATLITIADGMIISDPVNKLILVRQASKWYKSAAGTLIP